jgi:cobalt/nickel transport system permease protein
MHISEGILSGPVLLGGGALAAGGTAVGLKMLDYDRIPQVAVLSAAFFVASLLHIPIGPSSAHLVLNGLLGLILGWVAFPAILVGLILQAILFQYGGLTSLGVNTVIMALPAVICFLVLRPGVRSQNMAISMASAFLCGAGGVFLGSLIAALAMVFTGQFFMAAAKVIVLAHIPVMVIEGVVAAICIRFLRKVKPEILEVIYVR